VRTFVRSSFDDPDAARNGGFAQSSGNAHCDEEEIVEQQVVTGIAYAKDEAQISLRRVGDRLASPPASSGAGRGQHHVDMIVRTSPKTASSPT